MLVIIHSGFPAHKMICVTDVPGTYKAEKKPQKQYSHIYQLSKNHIHTTTHTHAPSSTLTPHKKTHKTQNSKKPDKQNNPHGWPAENFPSDTKIFCVLNIPNIFKRVKSFHIGNKRSRALI